MRYKMSIKLYVGNESIKNMYTDLDINLILSCYIYLFLYKYGLKTVKKKQQNHTLHNLIKKKGRRRDRKGKWFQTRIIIRGKQLRSKRPKPYGGILIKYNNRTKLYYCIIVIIMMQLYFYLFFNENNNSQMRPTSYLFIQRGGGG